MASTSHFLLPLPVPPTQRNPSPTALAHSLLADDEEWIYAQDGVGLYHGNTKIPTHQLLSVQLTTHRLLFICLPFPTAPTNPEPTHLQIHLADIRQIEHYTGFLRSSPKITLQLGVPSSDDLTDGSGEGKGTWTCRVCGFQNDAPTSRDRARRSPVAGPPQCQLCGIVRSESTETQGAQPRASESASTTATTTTTSDQRQVACERCTYLNDARLSTCEICGGHLPTSIIAPAAPAPAPQPEVIRISFRRGGDKEVYRRLKTVLASRTWQGRAVRAGTDTPSRGIGIDGILANIDLENRNKTNEVKDAFEDLSALMVRAGEMVKLVQSLTAKISTSGPKPTPNGTSDPEAETRTFLRSSLVQLGLPVPAITQDAATMKDEREYLGALAGEFAGLLVGSGEGEGLMTGKEGRGVVGMDEAWVVWNRARGVSLISPSVMQKVVPLLATHTRPTVEKLRFLSGLEVLHTPVYSPPVFARRISRRLEALVARHPNNESSEPYTTTLEIALTEGLSVSLTKEMLAFFEMIPECGLVRDEQGDASAGSGLGAIVGGGPVEERWYRDLITGFVWVDVNGV